jgi:hypothetical protein
MPPPLPQNSGLFIIAPDGTLRQKTVNDLPVGRSVDEVLRLVKAFQVRLVCCLCVFEGAGVGGRWGKGGQAGGRVVINSTAPSLTSPPPPSLSSHPFSNQFTDEHGEVCPANWVPGSASMKADPKGSLEYFSKVN